MNYTGNPRHLRTRPRSSQKEFLRRRQLGTPAVSERPVLDICHGFQDRTGRTVNEAHSVPPTDLQSVANGDNNTFDAKRRRLLLQQDWLGLDVAAPIKVRHCQC